MDISLGHGPLKVGYYTDLGDAARAYNAAAQRYFGAKGDVTVWRRNNATSTGASAARKEMRR